MPDGSRPHPDAVHPVGAALSAALHGWFPPDDGTVTLVAPWRPGVEAVVSFTAHTFLVTTLSPLRLMAAGVGAHGEAFAPPAIAALAGPDGEVDSLDLVLLSSGTGQAVLPERPDLAVLPERPDLAGHPRVRRARAWRDGVRVHGDGRGLVTVSRGLGGVAELSVEVEPGARGQGAGRGLLSDARGLVPAGEPVVVLVAPGNARSLRAGLAAGFVPVAAAQLIRPRRHRPRPR